MAFTQVSSLRRAPAARVKIWKSCAKTLRKIVQSWRDPRQNLPQVSDHLARDMGLDKADLEWSRLQLPSQTTWHPRG